MIFFCDTKNAAILDHIRSFFTVPNPLYPLD
jgi:hypothetical protein